MKGKRDIIALYYKIIEINLLKSLHGTHRKKELFEITNFFVYYLEKLMVNNFLQIKIKILIALRFKSWVLGLVLKGNINPKYLSPK